MAKTKLQVRLLGDRVLIDLIEGKGEATTASGIIIPGKEGSEKHERGKVVLVGPGRIDDGDLIPIDVKTGDIVWFKRGYNPQEVTIENKEYILISAENILAVEA